MKPEGSTDDSDQEGLPDEQEDDDDPPCPPVANIWRSRVEDLGDNIQKQ